MRQSLRFLPCAVLLNGLIFGGFLHSQDISPNIPGGHWKFTESFESENGGQTLGWAFELVDDGSSTLIAVGRRIGSNGEEIKDPTVGILFIDRHEDGTLGGSLIEAFGDGKQIELSLDIDVDPVSKEMSMASFDKAGSIHSKFKGQWLGKGLQSTFQDGQWDIREIVAPGKGSWDIQWKYKFTGTTGKISGRGNKAFVNGRKSYRGEANTYCQIDLNQIPDHENAVVGEGVETNYKGSKSRMGYEGWLSPSGRTFFLMSYESDGLAALLVGRLAE